MYLFFNNLVKNNLLEDYENEKRCILEAYDRYCARNWAFEKTDFIDFFNTLYGKKFKTFGFDNRVESLLTSEILDEVIGNNNFIGFKKIKDTNIGKSYFSSCSQTDREKYCCDIDYRRGIFKQYHDLVSEYCSDPKVTVHYFIYNIGVPLEDEKVVEELIDWCLVNSNFTGDLYSEDLKRNTDIEMRKNFKDDLLSDFKFRKKIFKRYLSIIDRDDITKYHTATEIRVIGRATKKEQFSKLTDTVVNRAKMAIDNNLMGWDIFSDIDLSQEDIIYILNKNGLNIRDVVQRNDRYFGVYSTIFKDILLAIIEYISSDLSIMDVCNKYGCLPESMSKYLAKYKEREPEIFEKFYCKAAENNERIDNSYIDFDHIADGIINGVVMPNGENRKYTYFDLIMEVGHNVNLNEIKKLLDKSYPNDYFIGNFFPSPVNVSGDLRMFPPCPREIRAETITINVDGNQHKVTDEERETVLGFLEKHKLPSCLYYDAVKAYLNGEFDPNKKIPNKRMVKIAEKSES